MKIEAGKLSSKCEVIRVCDLQLWLRLNVEKFDSDKRFEGFNRLMNILTSNSNAPSKEGGA